ncbi:hypothetical protein EDD66_105130 [Mobilisporobacter senegalensis]|uniref:Uncharacterized protein n=1 Tax=Mobilisporobacter senegalensis TaxID=1329262 RepID=A0A3N1XPU5_9FIRM|nr:hypothetical protein [Mobilisporobacter senegalensis]ROR28191.1 hypothetical protein EDD66_105130 [Mobilisporobacter senegalensis]
MDNSLKGLILAAGTIITCIVIGLGFYIAREARDTAAGGAGQISKLNAEFNESDKVMYDALEVSGSEVVNVVNKFKNADIGIKVTTMKKVTYYINNLENNDTTLGDLSSASIKDAQKSSSSSFINPNAQFLGEILRDVNETIIGISFKQLS